MRLTHKHIVRTYNVFSESDSSGESRFYIVMEYMAGGSLEQRLLEGGRLPTGEAVRIAAEVCAGLACAHEAQVVHCDLKPANILFDAAGVAKVADFGIAHVSGETLTRSWMTPAGFVAGTLPYMSPEQADGVRDDPRLDLYALGAVLYRALTGRTYLDFDPHETPRAQAANVARIYEEDPLPPSQHNGKVPGWLDAVVLQTLAKQPGQRYGSAAELQRALLQSGDSQDYGTAPDVMRHTGPVTQQASRPAWFWVAAGAAAVLLVTLAIAIPFLLAGGEEKRAAGAGTVTTGTLAVLSQTATPARTASVTLAPTGTSRPGATEASLPAPTHTPAPPTLPPALQADGAWLRERDGAVMVLVRAGGFPMGSQAGDANERPVHTVYLDAFWIDRTEVTNAQYRGCVDGGACSPPANRGSYSHDSYFDDPAFDGFPVINVDWMQASAYCAWTGARLPTEAEWEKAARGDDGRTFPWGEELDCTAANYSDCGGDVVRAGSAPSGASPYGALDMAGNVWEWVADWYSGDYYANSPERNPTGPDAGEEKVLRGGSWDSDWYGIRATVRFRFSPDDRSGISGFRCAVPLDE
jgi:formylglycine-generating enzyme required for sulfatase activity